MKINIRKIDVKKDERGWLIEAIKSKDVNNPFFGLIHVTNAKPGCTRGGHFHKRKTEWFCVIKGEGELFLKDLKSGEEQKFKMEEKNMCVIGIPPYTFHSIKNTGKEDLYLIAYVSEDYNPSDPDTFKELNS